MSFEFRHALCSVEPELNCDVFAELNLWLHSFRMSSVGMSTHRLVADTPMGIWHSEGAWEASLTRVALIHAVVSLIIERLHSSCSYLSLLVLGRSRSSLFSLSSRDLGACRTLNSLKRRECSYVITWLWLLFGLYSWLIDCPLWFGVSKSKKFLSKTAMSFEFRAALCSVEPELKRCLYWTIPSWFHSFRMSSVGMSTHRLDWTHRWAYGIVRVPGKLHSLVLSDPRCSRSDHWTIEL